MYVTDKTQTAITVLKEIGLAEESGVFGKRVHSCVVQLLKEFFSQTHTPFSAEFALNLFDRLARGKPITADFMMNQQKCLEAIASDKQITFSQDEEEGAWLSDRYGMTPQQAGIIVAPMREEKKAEEKSEPISKSQLRRLAIQNPSALPWCEGYGFTPDEPPRTIIMDNYGAAPSLVPNDEVENEGETPETKEEKKDMCLPNTNIVQTVRGIVDGLCDDLTSFTGVDVSNAVKRAGHSVRHREVAPIVRELYSDGELDKFGYSRELIKVSLPGGRQADAWLYHHQTSDPSDYDTRAQVALPPGAPAASAPAAPKTKKPGIAPQPLPVSNPLPPPPQATVAVTAPRGSRMLNTASQQRTQKGDGRLEIPNAWIRQLGWVEGDDIRAVKDGNDIVLKPIGDVTAGEETLYKFKVDRWNRIRVTNRALNKVNRNFGQGGQHIVTLQTNSIKVG